MANTDPIMEEDLLIIPDNSSKEDTSLFFLDNELPKKDNVDNIKVESLSNNNDLFSFDTAVSSNMVNNEKKDENSLFDFWAPNLDVKTESTVVSSPSELLVSNEKKEISSDDLLDFWLVVEEKKEPMENIKMDIPEVITTPVVETMPEIESKIEEKKIVEEVKIEENDDLNNIIESTIKKLDLRKWKISDKKNKNLTKIEDLRFHIETLEKEKLSYEEQNTKLDEESKKIDLNVKQLEKMKIVENTEEIKETVTKKH